MANIRIVNIEELIKATSTKPLKDKDVQIAVHNAQIAEDVPLADTGLPLNFVVKASTNFQILSIKNADVEDNVVGKDGLVPAIPNKIWLKYSFLANAEVKGGGTLSSVGFQLQAQQSLKHHAYHLHDGEETVMKAISGDLLDVLSVFSKKSILERMKVGEAVALQISGGLQAGITAKWADIFSQSLNKLTSLLPTKKTVAIKVSSGLQAAFTVKVTDDFVLKIAKTAENEYKIVLKKDLSKTANLGVFAGIEVALDKPENVEKIFSEVLEGLLGVAEKQMDELVRKIKNELSLDKADEVILQAILVRLGEEVNVDVQSIPQKIQAYKLKVKQKITEIAQTAIRWGFSLEYQRTAATSELLVAKLTTKAMDELHWDLLKFNLLPFHEAIVKQQGQAQPDIKVESYLHKRTDKTAYSWGFSFGIGKFLNLSSVDKTVIEITSTKNEQGQQQLNCAGEQFYTGVWNKVKQFWGSRLLAQTSNFTTNPTFSDLQYDFSLFWKPENSVATSADLAKIIDVAALWKCIDDSTDTTYPLLQTLQTTLDKAKDLRYVVHIHFTNAVWLKLLRVTAKQTKEERTKLLAEALAAATPYQSTVPIRQSIKARTRAYLPLWTAYLQEKLGEAAQTAAEFFKQDSSLADFERNKGSVGSFASLGANEDHILRYAHQCLDYLAKLNGLITQKAVANDKDFKKVFENANVFWEDSFHTQVFGYYIMELAENQGFAQEVERIFTIQYTENKEIKTLTLSQALGETAKQI